MPTTTKATKAKTAKPAKKAATKTVAKTGTKVCPGVPGLEGYPAHEAPTSTFASNAYNKDGLSRKCRVCWPAYTKSLAAKKAAEIGTTQQNLAKGRVMNEAAAAAKAAEAPAPEAEPATEAPAEAPSEPEAAPEPSTPEVEVRAVPEPQIEAPVDGEPAARRKRIQRERALARAGGAGTEQGQALLAQWAAESQRDRAAARPRKAVEVAG
jgi:hypothetical protein